MENLDNIYEIGSFNWSGVSQDNKKIINFNKIHSIPPKAVFISYSYPSNGNSYYGIFSTYNITNQNFEIMLRYINTSSFSPTIFWLAIW